MGRIFSITVTVVSVLLHIVALLVVVWAFWPIASWYYFHRPILGVDFFNTYTYVSFLRDNISFLPWNFKYFWYTGSPLSIDPTMITWFFPISIVAFFYPLLEAVKVSVLGGFVVLLIFFYLAAFTLSRHHVMSAAMAVLVVLSANMYGSLVWGGSLPYFINQLTFPLVLLMVAKYLSSGNKRWFWGSVLAMGLAFRGHLANAGAFVLPGAAILLIFGRKASNTSIKSRFKDFFVFFFSSYFLSYSTTQGIFRTLFSAFKSGNILNPFGFGGGTAAQVKVGNSGITFSGDESLIAYERSRFDVLFSDTHPFLFYLVVLAFGLLLVVLVVDRKKSRFLHVLPWLILMGYSVAHVFLNAYGFSFLPQAWYRAFWHFPITAGFFVAAVIGYSRIVFASRWKIVGKMWYLVLFVVAVVVAGISYQSGDYERTISLLEKRSSPSSAFPEAINLVRDQDELDSLLEKLTPVWLDANDRNWRLYESDAQVNVWWSGLFNMPLSRGYTDPPIGSGHMGHIFLLDQSIGAGDLVKNFNYDEDTARNMALYYIDWNGIRYFEGGHVSISDNKAPSPYLYDYIDEHSRTETVGLYRLYETPSGQPEIMDIPQYLEYDRFSDEIISPVVSVTHAPALLCICDDQAYESLTRTLGMHNINSRNLVTAVSSKRIDSYSLEDLEHFEVIMLSSYKYGDQTRAFSLLEKYVSGGGKVFIDTGAEVKESEASSLPSFFPFSDTYREGLGREWDLTLRKSDVVEDIDFSKFSPPLYNDMEWKFSYTDGELGPPSEVIISQAGNPVLVRWAIGEGEVVWSGMNLAYHVQSSLNTEESRFFVNLVESLVPLKVHDYSLGEVEFVSDRNVKFQADKGGKGVLFKEQLYDGWDVKVNGISSQVFASGPAYPGFIYVPLDSEEKAKVEFVFKASMLTYRIWLFQLFLGMVFVDLFVFDGRFVGRRLLKFVNKVKKRVGGWWEKEEE